MGNSLKPPDDSPKPSGSPRAELSVFDATAISVGIVIGAGIYETLPLVATMAGDVFSLLGAWLLGGMLALLGALCYAELATTFPSDGGDYVYLRRAYGRTLSFVFAWSELWVVGPGSIGFVAFVFARYANRLVPLSSPYPVVIYAVTAIVALTLINVIGVRAGKWTQNMLTSVKVLGLAALVVVALCVPSGAPATAGPGIVAPQGKPDFSLAMILVMFTYGGWSQIAFVAAEVRDARRNILRALVAGVSVVTAVYCLVALASALALGFNGLCNSRLPAADILEQRLGDMAGRAISLLICISCLGSINGQLLTNARIYAALGKDHRVFAPLGRWSRRFGTPTAALLTQMVAAIIPVVAFGLKDDGFQSLVNFTTPVFWFFFLLVGVGLIVLRETAADAERPFRVPAYPWTPLAFCLSSFMMLYSSLNYAIANRRLECLWAIVLVALGYILSFFNWDAPGEDEATAP